MKQLKIGIAYASIIFSTSLSVFAQTDIKAKKVLDEVNRKYQTFHTIHVDFAYTIDNPQARIRETQLGTLILSQKTNKYKVLLGEQELISDGKKQWIYLKTDKEVQITEANNRADAINPAQIFTIYKQGFKYLYVDSQKLNGKTYHMIDLVPLDSARSFFKIRLQINQANNLLAEILFFEKDGSRYTYSIKSFKPNIAVPESTFRFDLKKHPEVEVVDLR